VGTSNALSTGSTVCDEQRKAISNKEHNFVGQVSYLFDCLKRQEEHGNTDVKWPGREECKRVCKRIRK
jgi:hypothetical protein